MRVNVELPRSQKCETRTKESLCSRRYCFATCTRREFAGVSAANSRSARAPGTTPSVRGHAGLDCLCSVVWGEGLLGNHRLDSTAAERVLVLLGVHPSTAEVGGVSRIVDGAALRSGGGECAAVDHTAAGRCGLGRDGEISRGESCVAAVGVRRFLHAAQRQTQS